MEAIGDRRGCLVGYVQGLAHDLFQAQPQELSPGLYRINYQGPEGCLTADLAIDLDGPFQSVKDVFYRAKAELQKQVGPGKE